ncbi:MAG: hypothetical protein IJV75_05030 [Alphaproteobacteria bacterium]|nr:hypothetical protein [Alphaproteobacteria bacterium]
MSNLKEQLTNLYPDVTLSESEIQNSTDNLVNFFKLCLKIIKQSESPQEVQGNQQKYVQNVKFMEE